MYSAISFLTFGVTSFLAFFVYFKSNSKRLSYYYSLWTLSIGFWSLFLGFSVCTKNSHNAVLFSRLLHFFAILLPPIYVHFVLNFLDKKKTRLLVVLYGISIVYLAFLFSDLFLSVSFRDIQGFYVTKPGIIYPGHILFFTICVLFVYVQLVKALVKAKGTDRYHQINYFFIATLIGYSGGFTNYLINYDVWIFPFYPFGNVTILLYVFIIGLGIVRYQFMNIEVVIKRTAVFAGLFAFVYGIFSVVTIIGQQFFKNSLGWNQWVAMIPTVAIITLALRPLEIFLTNATERFLFQKKYDYRELLKTLTDEVLTVLDLIQLPQQTVLGLIRIMKLESAAVLLFNKDFRQFSLTAASGVKEKEIIFKDDDAIVLYLKASNQHILRDKDSEKIEGEGHLKGQFKRLNAKLCLPISLHDDMIGILSLGAKKSGEDYTDEDIAILDTLAKTLAIAISNAQLFDELSKTQAEAAQREKMAVIGTLAAGINHEICNPLGIVRGQCEMFLLNQRDGFYDKKPAQEVLKISSDIMNKVIKETDRATAITKKLSGFAKPSKRSDLEQVLVEKEIDEVIGLVGHDLKLSNIDFHQDFPKNFPVILADKKQIQEVLFNIIRNAAQAMEARGKGKISVTGFMDNDYAVIRIADNGTGIPADKIGQIFNPFYTTKAPGKGTGLGLFIVKQVVERNKGTIAVESELGVGTTFTLRFPTALKAAAAAA